MKKYSILVATALASLAGFTSCDDVNDCGCDCSVPVIDKVENLNTKETIKGEVEAGSYVAILGSNLGSVTAIDFGGKIVSIKPAYRTDNSIVLQIPVVSKSCVGKLITESCPSGFKKKALTTVVGTPEVYMAYNEFVGDGGTLKIKGASFVGDDMQAIFRSQDGTETVVSGSNLEIKNNDGTEMYVTIPNGLGENLTLIIRNNAEGKECVAPFLFRDCRNLLCDFESEESLFYTTKCGIVDKTADGAYNLFDNLLALDEAWADIEEGYSRNKATRNQFGTVRGAAEFEGIIFAPDFVEEQDEVRSVYGSFKKQIQSNPDLASNFVVKFEVNVDKDAPTNGMCLAMGFTGSANDFEGTCRKYCATLQMSEVDWDKPQEGGWTPKGAKDFNTDGWMTVTVPMSEFIWNFEKKNYTTSAENFSKGDFSAEGDQEAFGDPEHRTYVQKYSSMLSNDDDMFDYFGGFSICMSSYDFSLNPSVKNNTSRFAIDNVRIVPNDGNGAIYPKLGFGIPTQHYATAPRTKMFQ